MINYDTYLSSAGEKMQGSAIRKMGVVAAGIPDIISFAPGYPDPKAFAWAEFREIASSLLSGSDPNALQYGPTRGFRPLVDALPEIVTGRGIAATTDQVLMTTGSQQGLDLLARVLCDPGDVVLVELPAYTGAIAAFRNVQADLVGVRQEADGIDLHDLELVLVRERAAGKRVNVIYVVPNFQNPTGQLISLEKRRGLLALAERHNLLIIEDDPYGDLYFGENEAHLTRPIKADDTEGRVVYLSSFSKTLAPGFRVAWVVAPESLVARLDLAKQAADLCTGSLDQRIVFEAWKRGVLAARMPGLRTHYREKKTAMESAMRQHLGDVAAWQEPRGGFFLWVALPTHLSGEALLARATQEKVIYVAGAAFFVDGTGQHFIRLSFSLPPIDRITEGVGRLARVVKAALAGSS
ncbi:MAG: PLP-dependent aminotransferase family protein [Acidobacteria bacterium]|nr:PLP-dependent aminotransferase family protein [Acidobacteriota bacterium]